MKATTPADWLDVIWASLRWLRQCRDVLRDGVLGRLRRFARRWEHGRGVSRGGAQAQNDFQHSTAEGGFWNPDRKWYVYWHDKDGSVHGDNLVLPVNFMAIAYGLCDDRGRRDAILAQTEAAMQKERLFFWPTCIYSFQKDELKNEGQWPFPGYENGDIFLSWGEVAVRAYAPYDPSLAVRYVKNVLDQYQKDGLAFQCYLRKTQRGQGNDILSGNALPMVGLYRDIYGIQPKWNRLYLEPHLVSELNGTQLKYWLRGQRYTIDLSTQTLPHRRERLCPNRQPGICRERPRRYGGVLLRAAKVAVHDDHAIGRGAGRDFDRGLARRRRPQMDRNLCQATDVGPARVARSGPRNHV